jgi:hypothetical protein
MNLSFESAFATAREFRRRMASLTSHVVSTGAAYTRRALRWAWSVRNPHAATSKIKSRNRETLAVEAIFTSTRKPVYATAGDRDPQSSFCKVLNLPVGKSIGRIQSEIGKDEGMIAEGVGPKPLRRVQTTLFEVAPARDFANTFNFKSLEELSSDLGATLQHIEVGADTVKEGATGTNKLLSTNGENDLNWNTDGRFESFSDIELCISILTETARVLRGIFLNRPDLIPRELLDDLQHVNCKIVKRLSNPSLQEREWRRNHVLH